MSIPDSPHLTPVATADTAPATDAIRPQDPRSTVVIDAASGLDDEGLSSADTLAITPRAADTDDAAVAPDAADVGYRRALRGLDTIDNYRIIDELGHGGMAVVYRAEDMRLHRQVALKILHPHIASRDENRERFVREARAAARLKHPHIIDIFGFSSPSAPVQYIAAELVQGDTLRDVVERGLQLPEIGAVLCLQVARALATAHAEGIIHRDVKPENIMLSRSGKAKLMDFGLARLLDAQTLTMTGAVLGSPAHMAPESIEGEPATERVDIFAFGTVLYFVTVGALPFDGRSPAVVLNAVLQGHYRPPQQANPRISRALAQIIDRCLARQPEDRYATALELQRALEQVIDEAGIDDPDQVLRDFVDDPVATESALKALVIRTCTARARAATEEGKIALAMRLCDRILALEPDNADAQQLIARVQRRRRRFALGTWSAALVALLAAAAGFVAWDQHREPTAMNALPSPPPIVARNPAPVPPSARVDEAVFAGRTTAATGVLAGRTALATQGATRVASTLALAMTAQASGLAAQRDADVPGRADPEPVRVEPQPPVATAPAPSAPEPGPDAAPPTFPVTLRIHPLSAAVRINGEPLGTASDVRTGLRLPAGTHRLELVVAGLSNGRVEERFEVVPGATNEYGFRVPWPDGFVIVESETPGNVVVDGTVGATNERVPVRFDGLENRRRIAVVVHPPTGAPYEESVQVRTDQVVRVDAPF